MSDTTGNDVLFSEQGCLGRITLNRPKAINALNHGMIRAIADALQAWADNAAIRLILIEGAGERGFCAGGDIRALYEDSKAGRFAGGDLFFRDEYRLNDLIAHYVKPVVALMDGIVMGGGIGLSAHASHRVVTPRSALAMPEVGIGFVPDVGGTFLLARAPGRLGFHAALTGGKLSAADALLCGLADICVAAESLPDLVASLTTCTDTQAFEPLLQKYAVGIAPSALGAARHWIDVVYAHATVEEILASMQAHTDAQALSTLSDIAGKSPTSLKVTLRLLQEARAGGDLKTCLQREYIAALCCIRNHDFVEGVRAAVVDKDRRPQWSPAALADISDDMVDTYFRASAETALF